MLWKFHASPENRAWNDSGLRGGAEELKYKNHGDVHHVGQESEARHSNKETVGIREGETLELRWLWVRTGPPRYSHYAAAGMKRGRG